MSSGDEQAGHARRLYAGTFHGVLSTQSLELPGYPFGSLVPYVLDREGLPLLLLSHLSQHTRNLDADPHCALTLIETAEGDVQQHARLCAVGDVLPVHEPVDAARYFAYFPQTREYHEALGFRFYRMQPLRFHWNGGFATARWFGGDRIVRRNPFDADTEARIIGHMNADHGDALVAYLTAGRPLVPGETVMMVGIDSEGIDLQHAGKVCRVPLPRTIGSAAEAREVLVDMARSAR